VVLGFSYDALKTFEPYAASMFRCSTIS
jgi:hypothetical protein